MKLNKVSNILIVVICSLLATWATGQTQDDQSTPQAQDSEVIQSSVDASELTLEDGALELIRISPEEAYALQRLRIQIELQDELYAWAQSRFWIIAIITLLIGFIGVRALVREMMASELKEAASPDISQRRGQDP